MKIGILTFVNGLNYGAKLQCWALKTALESYGYEVCMFDRRSNFANTDLKGVFASGPRGWVKFFLSVIYGMESYGSLIRIRRTIRFVNGLSLTPYCFVQWKDAPAKLGVDLIVVGSDQVWHCGDWGDPRPYLLVGAPEVNAISYAASFGLRSIPVDYKEMYEHGLARFSAISCREREGVELCRQLGFLTAHVVDPTILLDRKKWSLLVGDVKKSRKLFCYFLAENVGCAMPCLAHFAQKMGCAVDIAVDYRQSMKHPKSFSGWTKNWRRYSRVQIRRDLGPKEFAEGIAEASWVVTDSFHALMLSSIFDCEVRFLHPKSVSRMDMFARIAEFAEDCVDGPLFSEDLSIALESILSGETIKFKQDRIDVLRNNSKQWLLNAITKESK